MVVAITRDGRVFFGNERIAPDQLQDKIRERLSHHVERKVYIKADASVRYGSVCPVLDAIRSAGVLRIGFLVDQRRVPTLVQ